MDVKYILILVTVLSYCVFWGCNNSQKTDQTESDSKTIAFNVQDKSIETNNNVLVAFEKLKQSYVNNDMPTAKAVDTSTLTQSPYSNIGNFVSVKGRVYKIEELPPKPEYPGKLTEVLMLSDDSNSALGVTTVECLCIGDVSHVKTNRVLSCGGYFVGSYSTQNAMGGAVEALAIVGNIQKK